MALRCEWFRHQRNALSDADLRAVQTYIGNRALRPSTVFNGEKEVVSTTRKSAQVALYDLELFDVAARVLLRMCPEAERQLRLVRSHADYIRSQRGDHFDLHRDFQILTGNNGETHLVLIVCLQSAAQGGELVLRREDGTEWTVSYRRGSAVLFPSNMLHRGARVDQGQKEILKFDIVSVELMWLLRVRGSRRKSLCVVSDSVVRCLHALRGKANFEYTGGAQGPLCTTLVSSYELSEAVHFLQNGYAVSPSCRSLQQALNRLSCPEGDLSPEHLCELNDVGVLQLRTDPASFVHHGRTRLVFVATSHHVNRHQSERAMARAATDFSGSYTFYSVSHFDKERAAVFEMNPPHHAGCVAAAIFEDALHTLEARQDLPVTSVWEEHNAPVFASLDLRTEVDFTALPQFAVISRVCADTLQRNEPGEAFTIPTETLEECNDGDSYMSFGYETVLLRRAFFLVLVPRWV